MAAIGAAATKTQCQSKCATMYPPTVGANDAAEATITLLMPIPLPSCFAG